MPATITQQDGVLAMLQLAGAEGVTPIQALNTLGCFRLAARVGELRAQGYYIENRGPRHARYVLTGCDRERMAPPPPPLTVGEQAEMWGK